MISKNKILETIQNHKTDLMNFGVNRIGLFGSYVRNEQTRRSDIDILVDFFPEKENYDNYMALYDYLENLFKKKIEIVTLNGLSPYIGPQILEEVIYV
ncbi:MAG: nucleotidyltransferase family protein [Candidatus Azobacteroides sp.]|jgi:predicted nucleotidyltransferase|nr:nucleotidyltransferase family protein [Candidatus Azobacteroides sp.]